MKSCSRLGLAGLATLATLALAAPAANALVVHVSNGRSVSVFLRPGLSAAAYERQTGARVVTGRRPAVVPATYDGLVYNGGPVLHTTSPYLVFWDPSSDITARSRQVMTQYFTGASLDSSNPGDVYAYRILSQYTDSGGSAGQSQTFSAGTQVIDDGEAYPSVDTSTCTSSEQSGFAHCITDNQIHAEVTRLINADHLPTGTGSNAPIYFVVTPENVNVCINGGQGCASDTFCAYHSSYTGPGSSTVIYASIPFTLGTGQGELQALALGRGAAADSRPQDHPSEGDDQVHARARTAGQAPHHGQGQAVAAARKASFRACFGRRRASRSRRRRRGLRRTERGPAHRSSRTLRATARRTRGERRARED